MALENVSCLGFAGNHNPKGEKPFEPFHHLQVQIAKHMAYDLFLDVHTLHQDLVEEMVALAD